MKSVGKAISMEIPLGVDRKMEIEIVDITDTYCYEVVTDQGDRYQPDKNIKHYRGVVRNNVNSIVALTCFEDEIMGIIVTEDGNFNIAYDRTTGLHVFYNDRSLKDRYPFLCSTVDDESVTYDAEVLLNSSYDLLPNPSNTISTRSATFNVKYVRFYFETEFDIYQARGNSVPSVEAFVTALYNQVATLYRNERIFTTLSEIHVWTTTDPYTENNTLALLNNFQNTRTSINGDLGQLLTFRSIGGGMAAGFNGLCNSSTRQKLSVCGVNNLFNAVPNYSWPVFVSTHEFGHLFGSRHTHACVWNGNNTAIDGCDFPEGNCVRPPIPNNGGTIMSYCHSQNVGINFSLGFGPQPGNVIRNRVNNAGCLPSIAISGPSIICNQETYTIENLPQGATIQWNTDYPLELLSGQGTGTIVVRNENVGASEGTSSTIYATITIGGQAMNLEKTVQAGTPEFGYFDHDEPYVMDVVHATAVFYGAENYTWTKVSGDAAIELVQGDPSRAFISIFSTRTIWITVTASNSCGSFEEYLMLYPEDNRSLTWSVYPNPADAYTVVAFDEVGEQDLVTDNRTSETHTIQLWNSFGMIRSIQTNQKRYHLDLSNTPPGFYYVYVIKNEKIYRKSLIINR